MAIRFRAPLDVVLAAYTKGERVLRFEVVLHNARELGCGRVLARFPQIVARLSRILERFLTTLDCVDVAFINDDTLDYLPRPSRVGKVRVGGIDLNNPRMRTALSAALALAVAPMGFAVAQFRRFVEAQRGRTRPLPANAASVLAPAAARAFGGPPRSAQHAAARLVSDAVGAKAATLVWNDAQQALIRGWQPTGYSANDLRIALDQLPAPP